MLDVTAMMIATSNAVLYAVPKTVLMEYAFAVVMLSLIHPYIDDYFKIKFI